MIRDGNLMFTGVGTSGYAPTNTGDNLTAPNTYDTAPLGLSTGSGGSASTGYNAGSSANAGRDLGIGGEMWFYILVTVTVTSNGAATVKFDFVSDSSATLANVVDSTGVGVMVASPTFAKATLVAGFRYATQLPAALTYNEFIGLDVVIGAAALTAGTFESGLVINIQQSDLYLSGFAVQ